jgi:hypothetical protein
MVHNILVGLVLHVKDYNRTLEIVIKINAPDSSGAGSHPKQKLCAVSVFQCNKKIPCSRLFLIR